MDVEVFFLSKDEKSMRNFLPVPASKGIWYCPMYFYFINVLWYFSDFVK